ncbi:MAG: hypothetical protein M1833_004303 [Piccolia ochrophora]|nr:MAG: hypothetical protein M1833_004303 [Piccolia ochrophora]
MAPAPPRKRKSSSISDSPPEFSYSPSPSFKPDDHSTSPIRTPHKSPAKSRPLAVTARQKQAMIDNLQLESTLREVFCFMPTVDFGECDSHVGVTVTRRARSLRAQYALQSQGLRSRIEMRINRIPSSLRKATMGDLFQKHIDDAKAAEIEAKNKEAHTRLKNEQDLSRAKAEAVTMHQGPPSKRPRTVGNLPKSTITTASTASIHKPITVAKSRTTAAKTAPAAKASAIEKGTTTRKGVVAEKSTITSKASTTTKSTAVKKTAATGAGAGRAPTRTVSRKKAAASEVLSPKSQNPRAARAAVGTEGRALRKRP